MDKIVISGIAPYDGEYEFDLADLVGSLTNRELHRIKLMSGVRAGELIDALSAGDNDLVLAFTVIVLERRGRRVDEDLFWDAPAGSSIRFDIEEDSNPPAVSQEVAEATTSSGDDSTSASESQENGLSPTGPRPLVTTAISDQEISAA